MSPIHELVPVLSSLGQPVDLLARLDMRPPTDYSAVIVPGPFGLVAGAYPVRAEQLASLVGLSPNVNDIGDDCNKPATGGSAAPPADKRAIARHAFKVIVCFMEPAELERQLGKGTMQAIGTGAKKPSHSKKDSKKATGGKVDSAAVSLLAFGGEFHVARARSMLVEAGDDRYANELKFWHLPIHDKGIAEDADVVELVVRILAYMRANLTLFSSSSTDSDIGFENQRKTPEIYMHCRGGHGRTGVFVSIILAVLFELEPHDALVMAQHLHDARHDIRTKRPSKSPETHEQRSQVHRILTLYRGDIIERLQHSTTND